MNEQLLRSIPKVDELINSSALTEKTGEISAPALKDAVRGVLDDLRGDILSGAVNELPPEEELLSRISERARRESLSSLRRVINGTGIVLHTNLGRARLSEKAARAAAEAGAGFCTLEYDVTAGGRGHRDSHVEGLICALTGAESAMVVNNNASAVLIVLSALASGGEVVTSRGELVEIGGGFRVPEIMESCGAKLREVGTTNKTRLRDYERAVNADTKALMKVHTSNFKIIGFSENVSREDMAALAHKKGLLAIEDLGSGCILDLTPFGIRGEPTVKECIASGMDVVSFSGDKLLGGPQAGIIAGRKEIIAKLKKHPLTRAMRPDKMTLAALECTLRSYADGTAAKDIPTLSMLAAEPSEIKNKADRLCEKLSMAGVNCSVVSEKTEVGGGSAPGQTLPTFAVSVAPEKNSVDALEEKLRRREVPIIGRISHDRYMLDMRTVQEEDFGIIEKAFAECEA